MKILVTGASGFVGSQIVTDLIKSGHEVVCCVRNVAYAKKLFPHCTVIYCDFLHAIHPSNWLSKLNGIDVVINTVGIFYHPNKKIIWQTHFDAPKALFDASIEKKIKKIIHISALAVDKYDVDYAKSKLASDEYLSKLPIPSAILRPSLIYGRGSYGGTSLFRGLSAIPFIIPVPGKGKQLFQPIYLPDLSQAILKIADADLTEKPIFAAVSKQTISLRNILMILRNWLGFSKAYVLFIPSILIKFGSILGSFLPNSTLNNSGYKMLMKNNITSENEAEKFSHFINFEPKNFSEGVFTEPSTVQDRWHAQLYWIKPLLQFSLAFLWIFTALCGAFFYPKESSLQLLATAKIPASLQPFLLYTASLINGILGFGLLIGFQVRKICLLQIAIILLYTFIITIQLPQFWFEPFGPISKNIPIIIATYILFILERNR